jgi:hypothetical protein
MDRLPCFPSAQKKWSKTRRKKTGKSVSCDVESVEKSIKEEAEVACARPHSGIRLSVINEVSKDSTDKEDDNKRNKSNNETANDNQKESIGGSGFLLPSPDDNCKGGIDSVIGGGLLIDSQSSADAVNEDCTYNSTSGIRRLNKNDIKILIEEEAENACVGSPKENRRIKHQHRQRQGQQQG